MNKWILIVTMWLGFTAVTMADVINVPDDFGTIQQAIDSAQVGDTVLVAPGTYVENVDFHGKKLVVASWFLTTGDTSYISQTVIDGNADSTTVSIQNFEPAGTELTGFSITNGLGTGDWPNVRGGGIHIRTSSPSIRYCYIYNNETVGSSNRGAGIYASSQYSYISNCRIYNNTSFVGPGIAIGNGAFGTIVDSCWIANNFGLDAILIAYSQFVTISNTFIVDNDSRALRSFTSNATKLIHCTIAGNGAEGVAAYGNGADTTYIINSIIYGNNPSFDFGNDTLVVAQYSLIEGADTSYFFGTGCLDADPLFAPNYQLSENSPAIDAGDPTMPLDPDGTVADMGAVYYNQNVTAIGDDDSAIPTKITLFANYPNPFNPETTIGFQLPAAGDVTLEIYTITGQLVKTLVSSLQPAGKFTVKWNGTNQFGKPVSSGVYLYRLSVGNVVQTRKMILLR